MKLFKLEKVKEGRKYTDFYLAWEDDNGKTHYSRIRPCFVMDYRYLHAIAEPITDKDSFAANL